MEQTNNIASFHSSVFYNTPALVERANQLLRQEKFAPALALLQRVVGLQTTGDENLYFSIVNIAADKFYLPLAEKYAQKILAQKNIGQAMRFKTYLILSRLAQFFSDERKMLDYLHAAEKLLTKAGQNTQEEISLLKRRAYHVALHQIKSSARGDVIKQSFAAMEWRKNISWETSFVDKPYHKNIPLWQGEALQDDQTLLVSFEQGFGDAIQFSRFIPMLYPRVKRLLFEVRAEMLDLFSSQYNTSWDGTKKNLEILVFPYGAYDQALAHPRVKHLNLQAAARVFLFSLPHLLQLSSPAVAQPYFSFEKLFMGNMPTRNILSPSQEKKKIGLVWSCGQDSNAQDRSIDIKEFLPLLSLPQYEFYSLQMSPQNMDIKHNGFEAMIKDLSPAIKDFADSAKILYHLDAVITVDTAMAHLAAAFGKKVFLLIPRMNDWRWSGVRQDEQPCWYGKNLFAFPNSFFTRQASPNKKMAQEDWQWQGAIRKLVTTLNKEMA